MKKKDVFLLDVKISAGEKKKSFVYLTPNSHSTSIRLKTPWGYAGWELECICKGTANTLKFKFEDFEKLFQKPNFRALLELNLTDTALTLKAQLPKKNEEKEWKIFGEKESLNIPEIPVHECPDIEKAGNLASVSQIKMSEDFNRLIFSPESITASSGTALKGISLMKPVSTKVFCIDYKYSFGLKAGKWVRAGVNDEYLKLENEKGFILLPIIYPNKPVVFQKLIRTAESWNEPEISICFIKDEKEGKALEKKVREFRKNFSEDTGSRYNSAVIINDKGEIFVKEKDKKEYLGKTEGYSGISSIVFSYRDFLEFIKDNPGENYISHDSEMWKVRKNKSWMMVRRIEE